MKLRLIGSWLLIAALAMALLPLPAASAAPVQQTNLVTNGSMESFSGGVASGWEPWWETIQNPGNGSLNYAVKPDFVAEGNPTFVQSGAQSQHIGRNWDPWHAGIRQTINVPAGSTVRITAYGRVFASTPDFPSPSDTAVQARLRIGAEPNGSIDWASGSVVWSGTANPHDTWTALTLDVTAGPSNRVTIFLSANFIGDSRYHLDVWWDNVTAVVVGQGASPTNTSAPGATNPPAATSAAQPTSAPPASSSRTATPDASGTIIYVVQEGDTLWTIAAIHNVPLDQIRSLNGLTSDFISVGQRLIISQGNAPSASATPEAGATEAATADPNATPDPAATEPSGGEPPPTQPPANATTAPATPTQGVGTVCVLLWNDVNGNGVRDANEGLLPGGRLTVVDISTGAPVSTYTTDGLNEPHCFESLVEGQYTISSAAPAGYNPTTNDSMPLQVAAGFNAILEFGAQASAAVAQTPLPPSNRVLQTAVLGAGGVVFLLLAAGVAALLVLRRPR